MQRSSVLYQVGSMRIDKVPVVLQRGRAALAGELKRDLYQAPTLSDSVENVDLRGVSRLSRIKLFIMLKMLVSGGLKTYVSVY